MDLFHSNKSFTDEVVEIICKFVKKKQNQNKKPQTKPNQTKRAALMCQFISSTAGQSQHWECWFNVSLTLFASHLMQITPRIAPVNCSILWTNLAQHLSCQKYADDTQIYIGLSTDEWGPNNLLIKCIGQIIY